MDPKILFWTAAFANMTAIMVIATRGVRQIRRGEVARHRKSMLTCGGLVGLFLSSYVLKVILLGREDLSVWSSLHRGNLYFHETCVVSMLLLGGFAAQRAWRMRDTRNVTRSPDDPMAPVGIVRLHRAAGRVAVGAAFMGLLTAGIVLAGMYQRL